MESLFLKKRKYFAIFGGFLIFLTLGGFYTSGNIQQDIVSYMKNNSYSASSISLSKVVFISSLTVFGHGASFTAGGFIEKRIGPSFTALIGGWFMSFNIALLYFTMESYLAIVILSYGFFSGIGIGFAYGSALGAPLTWFTENRGLITGLIVSGFGISPTMFSLIQDSITNDCLAKNLTKFRDSFLMLGFIYAILQLIGSSFLKNYSLEKDTSKANLSIQGNQCYVDPSYSRRGSVFEENPEMKPHQILREFDFWILWMTFFLNSTCVVFISQITREYALLMKISTNENLNCVKVLVIISGVFQFCGRIFWGFLMDKKSYKVVMLIITIFSCLFIGTLSFIQFIVNKTIGRNVYCSWIAIVNFLLSGNLSVFPIICAKSFGTKYFICNYGMLYTACSVSGALASVILSIKSDEVFENYSKPFYNGAFISCSVMSLIAAGLTLLFRGRSIVIYNF